MSQPQDPDDDHYYDMLEAQELAADVADAQAAVRYDTLVDVMQALKQERGRMNRANGYTLANVYGMNNAVDVVAKMIGEANG